MKFISTILRHRLALTAVNLGYCQSAKMSSTSNFKPTNEGNGDKRALIAVCQMTATPDKAENWETVQGLLARASQIGAKMVFLPESCDYIAESKQQAMEQAEPIDGTFIEQCRKAAVQHNTWLSIGGFHRKSPDSEVEKILNTHVMISSTGEIRAIYDKTHLFDLDIPGKVRLRESDGCLHGDRIVPPVETPIGRVGLASCYDMRFAEMALALRQDGAHVLTYPSAFTVPTGLAHWETLLRARAIETQCYVVASAQTGKHNAKRSSYGHAMVLDPWGAVVAQCSEGTGMCLAEIDLEYLDTVRTQMPVWQHRRTDLYGQVKKLQGGESTAHPNDTSTYQFGHVTLTSDQVFYRTPLSIASVNIKPVLPGHTMVIPLRPAAHISDLTPAEVTDLFTTVQKVSEIVKKHFGATSVTVAVQDGPEAGQTVQHVHVHIMPRKKNDFEDNDDIYDHLQNHDKGWNMDTKFRSAEEMAKESVELRTYFYPS